MIRVNIMYPYQESFHFDWEYYLGVHLPMAVNLLKDNGMKEVQVETGLMGGLPNTPPTYVAMCHFTFESIEAFMNAFMPHMATLQNDIANYTNLQATIQFSEIRSF